MSRRLRMVVVEDHPLFLSALRALIESTDDMEVVAAAADAHAALAALRETEPDLAVVDLRLPGIDGLAATREIRRQFPKVRVLLLPGYCHAEEVLLGLEAGATGVALKSQSPDQILEALRTVAAGTRYVAPEYQSVLAANDGARTAGSDVLTLLSPRERDVFSLVIRGFSNEAIAFELRISNKTVETHRAHINRKLSAHSTADLVRFAARYGLLSA